MVYNNKTLQIKQPLELLVAVLDQNLSRMKCGKEGGWNRNHLARDKANSQNEMLDYD